jgi:hypothetical protein
LSRIFLAGEKAGGQFQSDFAHSQTESRFESKGIEVIASRFRLVFSSTVPTAARQFFARRVSQGRSLKSFQKKNAPKEGA